MSAVFSLMQGAYRAWLEYVRFDVTEERCGIFSGYTDRVGRCFWPVLNHRRSKTTFAMDPEALITAVCEIEQRGEHVLAISHSQQGTARISAMDEAGHRFYAEAVILIADVERDYAIVQAYARGPDGYHPVSLEVRYNP